MMHRARRPGAWGALSIVVIALAGSPPATAQTVSVDFSGDRGPVTRRGQGYLYSWWHTRESPMHGNLELRPTSWRIGYWGTWDYEYQPMADQGIGHIQVILTDAFRNRGHTTVGGFSHDFSWHGKSYVEVVEETVKFVNERGWKNVAFDLINEPDAFGIDGIDDWYRDAWVPAFRRIRQLRPQAEIVGPGFFSANLAHLTNFIARAKADNVVPDIISQHLLDNQNADVVESYNNQIRAILANYGLAQRPISFNEYINPGHISFVEDVVNALAQGERVQIHSMMHSSWDDSGELPPWNSTGDAACFDGIMSIPAQRERACYWVYKFYGDMTGRIVSSSGSPAGWEGVASYDGSGPVARILLGGKNAGTSVTLALNNLPAGFGSSLNVRVERVTSNGNDLTPAPTLHSDSNVPVSGGSASTTISGFPGRTALMVTVRPAGLPAKVATPTFSPLRGSYWKPVEVTLSCATAGATIRYTTNGALPTASSPVYAGAIRVPVTTTIRAYAAKSGMPDSEIANGTFTIRRFVNGLYGEYFPNTNLSGTAVLTRGDPTLNIDYGTARWDASLPYDNFSARWTGRLRTATNGTYLLHTVSDDGIRLWLDGTNLIDNWTTHPKTTNTASVALDGGRDYDLRVEYFDAGGGKTAQLLWTPPGGAMAVVPNARLFPPTAPGGTNLLVMGGTAWKYLAPTNAAGAPAAAWKDPGFADGAWNSGPARLGYGNDGEMTPISTVGGRPFTVYFRKTFDVPNPAALAPMLDLGVIRDDGAVVYLNGTELFRDNMPTGAVSYSTAALGGVGNDNERTPVMKQLASSLLLAGTNTLAVEIHQSDSGSEDLGFDLELSNPTNNTPPRIGPVPSRSAIAGETTEPIGFSVYDGEVQPQLLTVSASSSNTGVIPNSSFVFGGFGPSRTLRFTPAPGPGGSSTITVRVSDGVHTNSTSFLVTVLAPSANTPPVIDDVPDRSAVAGVRTDEILFNVADDETEPGLLSVTAVSSNPGLIQNTNLFINGTGGWRTLAMTPTAGQFGTSVVSLVVSDGSLAATDTVTVTVSAAPILVTYNFDDGTLQGWTDLTVSNANAGPRNWALAPPAFPSATHNGAGAVGQNIVGGNQDSPHPTLWLRSPEFRLNGAGALTAWLRGGTGSGALAGQSVSSVPADATSPGFQGVALRNANTETFVLSGGKTSSGDDWQQVSFSSGQLSALDQNAVYTLDLIDVGYGGWGWVAMDTVSIPGSPNLASNSPPTISDVTNRVVAEESGTGPIPFTIGDAETGAASLLLSGASSNTGLVPNANIVFGGSGSNRTVTVTPLANRSGTTTITLTVTDGALTASDTFVLTVTEVNDPPYISDIADRTIPPGTNTGAIAFIVTDDVTPASSLTVTPSSSNTNLVPLSNIVMGGGGSNRTVTVTPAGAMLGTSLITLTVNDGSLTNSDSFVLTVSTSQVYTLLGEEHFLPGGSPPAGQYSIGSVGGQNPTVSGWSGAWIKAGGDGDAQFNDLGLAYAGLQSSGGRIWAQNATRTGRVVSPSYGDDSSGTVYLSLLLKLDSDHSDRYRCFELHNGGFDDGANRVLQLGQHGGDLGVNGFGLRINNNSALQADLGAVTLQPNLFVLKFVFSTVANGDSVTVWRNPSSLGGAEPGGGITLSGFDFRFDRTSLASWATPIWETYMAVAVDEIRLGDAWAAVTPPGSSSDSRLVFDFDDGTFQGWTNIWTNNDYSPQYFEVAGGGDAQSGGFAIKQHLADTWPGFADLAHTSLWVRSPEFKLNGSGDLSFWLMGGGSNLVGSPPAGESAVPPYSVDTVNGGFHGVVLRNAASGSFVLVGNRATNGAPEGPLWQEVRFTAAQLAALDQNAVYTLDLIDARNNSWGWCNLDTVVIPGTLTGTGGGNRPPTISDVTNRTILVNAGTGPIPVTVGDAETPAASLTLQGSSSNQGLVPNANIVFGGSGSNRTVTVTPVAGQAGSATLTLTVGDGELTASDTFVLTVVYSMSSVAYDFEDGTLQGWTVVSSDAEGRQYFAIVPPIVSSPNGTPHSGTTFVGLHIPSFSWDPLYTQDSTHNTLWLRSPRFKLNGAGNLSAWLSGGHGYGADATGKLVANVPGTSFDDPGNTTFPSFIGIALRNVDTGVFVLAGHKASEGNDWQQVTFTASQLAALDQNATYTLDLIDVRQGGWGWVNMDDVVIPGSILPGPYMKIQSQPGNPLALSWPTNDASGYNAQSTTNLMPPVTWTTVIGVPVQTNGHWVLPLDVGTDPKRFYKLQGP